MTAKVSESTKINFAIHAINVIEFHLDPPATLTAMQKAYNYSFYVVEGYKEDEKLAAIELTVTIKTTDEKIHLATLKVQVIFLIENFKDIVVKNGDNFDIISFAHQMLVSIALSTTRGIFFQLIRGSVIQNAIIPIIDINQLIPAKEQKPE